MITKRDKIILEEKLHTFEKSVYKMKHRQPTVKTPEWKRKAQAVLNACKPEYKWIAMDKDGDWCVYTTKPCVDESAWGGFGFVVTHLFDLDTAPYWQESLIERSE